MPSDSGVCQLIYPRIETTAILVPPMCNIDFPSDILFPIFGHKLLPRELQRSRITATLSCVSSHVRTFKLQASPMSTMSLFAPLFRPHPLNRISSAFSFVMQL
ncbi:hypothetical protein BDN71DRAFT_1443715, partial [Pleurotus eryngii]